MDEVKLMSLMYDDFEDQKSEALSQASSSPSILSLSHFSSSPTKESEISQKKGEEQKKSSLSVSSSRNVVTLVKRIPAPNPDVRPFCFSSLFCFFFLFVSLFSLFLLSSFLLSSLSQAKVFCLLTIESYLWVGFGDGTILIWKGNKYDSLSFFSPSLYASSFLFSLLFSKTVRENLN